jgi:hypothetical protein
VPIACSWDTKEQEFEWYFSFFLIYSSLVSFQVLFYFSLVF